MSCDDPRMGDRIYSVGYEGMTVEGLVERLVGARVTTLVDVRLHPVSRKPGFSRRRLAEALAAAGIAYVHEKELGNPPDNRASFRDGDGRDGRARMRAILSDGAGGAIDRLVTLAAGGRIAVLCVEREHDRCHRAVVTELVAERNPGTEVIQLL